MYRGLRDRKYLEHLGERLGFLPQIRGTTPGSVWLHAVSVGEVLSAVELIRGLREAVTGLEIFVSTTTLAGRAMAEQRLNGLATAVFFAPFPLDYRSVIRRVLRKLRPALVVVMETEIWPNFYREARRSGASLVVVNGRISSRALPRYVPWLGLLRYVLELPNTILVQSAEDARRYGQIGAPEARVLTLGNIKYDFKAPGEIAHDIQRFLQRTQPAKVWIAASTMPPTSSDDVDEDEVVILAFAELCRSEKNLFLILAPRRPERFDVVAQKLTEAGVNFVRRSQLLESSRVDGSGVLLLDSIGELAATFSCADVVFMGGTLAQRGGHNILEPAFFGKPTIVGPHMENFAEIAQEFLASDALVQIRDASELMAAVRRLLNDAQTAREVGESAQALANAKRGAVDRVVKLLVDALGEGVSTPVPPLLKRVFVAPLAGLWWLGHKANIALASRRACKLNTRVVSIGGIAMGGVGKTPMVAHLAGRLLEAGLAPAILTRGYRRESKAVVIVPKGGSADIRETGDEAQWLIGQNVAHVGIGSDRFAVGQQLARELKPGVVLLDDGFQHIRLHRDQDIVLMDAQDPLAGGLFPLGLRREPLDGLARATAIVITRAERGTAGIEKLIRKYNATAPIYRSRMVVRGWEPELPLRQGDKPKVAAFCGIGSPGSFWRMLEQAGVEVVYRKAFPDHYKYSQEDLQVLARNAKEAGADILVTTEKDRMNLGEVQITPLKIHFLKIGVEIDNEDELLRQVRSGLAR
ncbi:MAG: tetraacyldisaccharide 4'-kinase [Acidobacteriota bacterium]